MFDAVTVYNPSMNPNRVFHEQWHLAKADSGAFKFDVCAPSGSLVVYLVDKPNAETLGDSRGYAIVFDGRRDPALTFVSAIPGFPTPHGKSRTNRGFALNGEAGTCRSYWVVYEKGTVLVGEGDIPGDGAKNSKLITCLQNDEAHPVGIKYFGFGAMCRETKAIEIKNIRTFDAPAEGCSWRAIVPIRCASNSPMAQSTEMFGSNAVACVVAE